MDRPTGHPGRVACGQGDSAPGRIEISVVPLDRPNQPPEPPVLEGRAVSGDTLKLKLPRAVQSKLRRAKVLRATVKLTARSGTETVTRSFRITMKKTVNQTIARV